MACRGSNVPDAASGSRGEKRKKFSGATSTTRWVPSVGQPALELVAGVRATEPTADDQHVAGLVGHLLEDRAPVVPQLGQALADVVEGPVAAGLLGRRRTPRGTSAGTAPSRSRRRSTGSAGSSRPRAGRRRGSGGRCRWSCRTAARCGARARGLDERERLAAPASSSVSVDASMAASSPLLVCISRTTSSMAASTSGGWCTTRSGPSATTSRSSSVTRVAISTMACGPGRVRSSRGPSTPARTGS